MSVVFVFVCDVYRNSSHMFLCGRFPEEEVQRLMSM